MPLCACIHSTFAAGCGGAQCFRAGGIEKYVNFPIEAIGSPLYVMKKGGAAEIAVIANDGIVGTSPLLGTSSRYCVAVARFKPASIMVIRFSSL